MHRKSIAELLIKQRNLIAFMVYELLLANRFNVL